MSPASPIDQNLRAHMCVPPTRDALIGASRFAATTAVVAGGEAEGSGGGGDLLCASLDAIMALYDDPGFMSVDFDFEGRKEAVLTHATPSPPQDLPFGFSFFSMAMMKPLLYAFLSHQSSSERTASPISSTGVTLVQRTVVLQHRRD